MKNYKEYDEVFCILSLYDEVFEKEKFAKISSLPGADLLNTLSEKYNVEIVENEKKNSHKYEIFEDMQALYMTGNNVALTYILVMLFPVIYRHVLSMYGNLAFMNDYLSSVCIKVAKQIKKHPDINIVSRIKYILKAVDRDNLSEDMPLNLSASVEIKRIKVKKSLDAYRSDHNDNNFLENDEFMENLASEVHLSNESLNKLIDVTEQTRLDYNKLEHELVTEADDPTFDNAYVSTRTAAILDLVKMLDEKDKNIILNEFDLLDTKLTKKEMCDKYSLSIYSYDKHVKRILNDIRNNEAILKLLEA